MKHLTILSYSLTRQCVDSFLEIASNLEEKGYKVKHVGLTDFSVLPNVRQIVLDEYRKSLSHVYSLPKIEEKDFSRKINYIVKLHKPDIFLTDNERINSVFLMNYFQSSGIPCVLVEHGYLSKPPFIYQTPLGRFLKQRLDRKNLQRAKKMNNMKEKAKLLMKNPPGIKGDYLISAMGELNKRNYFKYGVDKKRIIVTGFPYFDRVVEQRNKHMARKLEKRKQQKNILIISSGLGMLTGKKEDAEQFSRFVITIVNLIGHDFKIALRFKPGENIFSMLSPEVTSAYRSKKIQLNDTDKKSYKAVAMQDLVIGDASFVLFESIIMGKPVLIFRYSKDRSENRGTDYFFRQKLGCLIIENPQQIKRYLGKVFSGTYRRLLANNLKKNEMDLFGKLDGHSGKKVADVILHAISTAKINYGQKTD